MTSLDQFHQVDLDRSSRHDDSNLYVSKRESYEHQRNLRLNIDEPVPQKSIYYTIGNQSDIFRYHIFSKCHWRKSLGLTVHVDSS